MFCTNSKCLNCSQSDNFESQTESKVEGGIECVTIIDEHDESFQQTHRSISKNLVSALITLSVLGETTGSAPERRRPKPLDPLDLQCNNYINYIKVKRYSCYVAQKICSISSFSKKVRVIDSYEIIREAINVSVSRMKNLEKTNHVINNGIPLSLNFTYDYFKDDCSKVENTASVLSFVNGHLYSYIKDNNLINPAECRFDTDKLCGHDKNPNNYLLSKCCSDIGSYLIHPNISLSESTITETVATTVASNIASSTIGISTATTVASNVASSTIGISTATTVASNVASSTIGISTATESELPSAASIISTSNIVLIVFLSLALALISFIGHRALKHSRSQQPQPISQSDNTENAEREDLV
ncbi:putative membrane protein [Candidatus Ichthyocystis hellenicum]|uniref:Putative membrane protein n=1 Tax=Candidatus Ichthyocystis hellenicum TaxID=1561003 RepID=A0A0S4M3A1_9BURK|nr:hypothetical protein [Candidatus Ichthyocystis hellenicum]CUT18245.1 putative membrane protein [Candidatus Ichthyocystis hellenicum]